MRRIVEEERATETKSGMSEVAARFDAAPAADGQTPGDAAALAVAGCLDLIGADVAFVATLAGNSKTIAVSRVTPYSKYPVHLTFPLDAPYPIAETIRTRKPLFLADNEELGCAHPGLVRVKDEDHACATLPLFVDEEFHGALNVGFEDPRRFSEADRDALAVLAERCALLIARR